MKGELQRLLAQAKARVDAPYEVGYHDERLRYRNWLSSINNDSGAWLKPLALGFLYTAYILALYICM